MTLSKTQRPADPGAAPGAASDPWPANADHRERLRQALSDPGLRRIEGVPLGHTEDILRLSDPPHYTAAPNPFMADFVRAFGSPYDPDRPCRRSPYAGEFRVSSRHPVHVFHPYHNKVPPSVVRTLIEHYTEPGDLVLDPFAGTGMTAVAARECGRHAIVADLSPAAAFIAGVNACSHDGGRAARALERVIAESERALGDLYRTEEGGRRLRLNYGVWSDVFACPDCGHDFPFFPHGVVHHGRKVETRRAFPCPSCAAPLNVRRVRRRLTPAGKQKALVWINAGSGRGRVNRPPTAFDLALARRVEAEPPGRWFPTDAIDPEGYSARLAQFGDKGISDVSRLLSRRNLAVFADLWARVGAIDEPALRNLGWAALTSIFTVISERQGYFGGGGGMSGNLYMPIVRMERNVYDALRRKLRKLAEAERAKEGLEAAALVSTQSATDLRQIPDASIDYVFTDPPFGANIIYSEVNQALEGWLRLRTQGGPEAVIDGARGRSARDYGALMRRAFAECHRVLKPGRWMTVEFHNTRADVWNLIQQVIGETGFVLARVGLLDKGSSTILGDIRPGAAKVDLMISVQKPDRRPAARFRLAAGSEDGAWTFLRRHLERLPQPEAGGAAPEAVAERRKHRLFDRVVAYHLQRGQTVSLSAARFYEELARRFPERDGMYFLPEQAAAYDRINGGAMSKRPAEPM